MNDRIAPTSHPIDPALAARWSPRAFASRSIEAPIVASLFEAARWAPSASNLQPWAFIHASRGTSDFDRLHGCLNAGNAAWAGHAALLVLAIAQTMKADGSSNAFARYDLGQAVAHLTFQAMASGLHVHQMAGFDAERARSETGIPPGYEAVSAIAIGYLGDPTGLPDPFQDRERAPRVRKPADTVHFVGRWPGQGG
ncbi:nitroreductase family protein [Bosea sp. PAMC 26642]|uniref:nitroreductase family protein n=1 Tax=Bosea sp. (strain PAMC 26642) TaxID=1792307 RepID=UPI000770585F|nr:nitroreductase family protein [Bosea sp. PAMC 26642]AMJ60771.1 hypothetical protein AXW83_11135 [Bosea sp. PAMC 26642]